MAGLWERVKPDAEDRLNIHLIVGGLRAYFVNTVDGAKGATRVQVRDALNNQLETALDANAENDLNAIADELDAQASNTAKLIFLAGLEYVMIAAEIGEVSEAKWRNDLGI